ncbi:MAG: hypothetical protein H7145_03840 [Akkermansiaceae bacterium]|nr:hypothetical protein [Armatimonadota bacterium]
MKYYLPYDAQALGLDAITEIAIRQGNAYAAYLDTIREKLPPALRDITHINFGDYQPEKIAVDLPASTVTIHIMGETITFRRVEQVFLLRFSGVTRFDVSTALRQNPSPFLAYSLEVEVHEVELIEPGFFEFRFAFHGRTEMAIRFKEFTYEIIDAGDVDQYGRSGEAVADPVVEAERLARTTKWDPRILTEIASQVAGGDAFTHYRLGKLALETGDYPLAVGQLTLAMECDPDHRSTRFALAEGKYEVHEYTDALSLIDTIRAQSPNHTGALLYHVRILGATGQWDALTRFCTESVMSVSGEVPLWLALALANTNRTKEAEVLYESISKLIRNKNAALNKRVHSALSSVTQ